jgi:hypothetical protein
LLFGVAVLALVLAASVTLLILSCLALPPDKAPTATARASIFYQSTPWLVVNSSIHLLCILVVMPINTAVAAFILYRAWPNLPDHGATSAISSGAYILMMLVYLGLTTWLLWLWLRIKVIQPWRRRRLPLLIIDDDWIWSPGFETPVLWTDVSAAQIRYLPELAPTRLELYQGPEQLRLVVLERPLLRSINLTLLRGSTDAVDAAIFGKPARGD